MTNQNNLGKKPFSLPLASQNHISWWDKSDGKMLAHFFTHTPKEKIFWGDVVIDNNTPIHDIAKFAEYQVIVGNLVIKNQNALPKFKVEKISGNLRVDGCNIAHQFDQLNEIGENLVVINADVSSLPNLQEIGGHLKMKNGVWVHAQHLEKIGNSALLESSLLVHAPCLGYVGGNIVLNKSQITHRPTKCHIAGDVYNLKPLHKNTKKTKDTLQK